MNDMPDPSKMIEAARLTRAGRLTQATALLQPDTMQGKIGRDENHRRFAASLTSRP